MRPTDALERERTGTSVSFADRGAPYEEIVRLSLVSRYFNERRVIAVLSGGAVFHPPSRGRWNARFFLGATNQHAHEFNRQETIQWPEGVERTPERLRAAQPFQFERRRNIGALTFGGGVVIAVTPRFSVAPDVRIDYGSIGDEIDNAVRPSVRLMWRF